MNIDISLYRASIGSFYLKYRSANISKRKYKSLPNSEKTSYKTKSYKYNSYRVIFIVLGLLALLSAFTFWNLSSVAEVSKSEQMKVYYYDKENEYFYGNNDSKIHQYNTKISNSYLIKEEKCQKLPYIFTQI